MKWSENQKYSNLHAIIMNKTQTYIFEKFNGILKFEIAFVKKSESVLFEKQQKTLKFKRNHNLARLQSD